MPRKYYDAADHNFFSMFNWLKNLFSGWKSKPKGCCGGGCCGHKMKAVSLDLGISENDKTKLKQLDSLIIVGKVLELRPHSNEKMTKVQVAQCDLGNGNVKQILCGGTNLEAGQVVPVAQVGAVLPGDFNIGERDIRGEMSYGMICASKELGLEREEAEKVIWPLPLGAADLIGTSLNTLV